MFSESACSLPVEMEMGVNTPCSIISAHWGVASMSDSMEDDA